MGFSDRLRAWFKGELRRAAPSPSTDRSSRTTVRELEAFVESRIGVEAYLEPRTAIYSTTLLLVADDGEYLRRPVRDRAHAVEFCGKTNIPLYDAAKVGYPRRMKDYDRGVRPQRIDLDDLPPWPSDGTDESGPPAPPPAPPRD
ncbi:oxidoreductase [Egicoccus sp. AB-alg6-2]|uniref:oxidoreductase n=1 Tax=Egicoccus sp. AB-alg6-2 TaxID=3242692 RepID=UPI00359D3ABD